MSKDEFADAIRSGLREYSNTDALARNPLVRCRLVLDSPESPAGACLQRLLAAAVEQLSLSGKDERAYAALKLTYLDATRTQEEAAELLRTPFSSYRRYLRAGLDRVVEWLWQRELHGGQT